MNDNYKNAFAVIADLWPNFKQPETIIGVGIWDKALSPYSEKTIMMAIEELYKTEHFFSFAKLTDMLDIMTKPQLPESAEVVQVIKRLARNSNQDVSKQPEYIQRTLGYLGGLKHLGLQTWDEWLEKSIVEKYEQAKVAFGKDELKQLGMAAERLGIE